MEGHVIGRSPACRIPDELREALTREPPRPRERLLGGLRSVDRLRLGVLSLVGLVVALELLARQNLYGLRVTGDAPSYIGLLYRLAQHPFSPANAYFPGVETSHATPDLQLAAIVWRAEHGSSVDPQAAYRLLALLGICTTLLLLHAWFRWVRMHAGSKAAWVSIPVLLTLFGPAHVIWAGDLSFNGLLYGSFYSQTLALGLAFYTLTALERGTKLSLLATVPLAAATMTVHPFTGLLLAVLVATRGSVLALRRQPGWWTATPTIAGGFLLGTLWPGYDLGAGLTVAGFSGTGLVIALAAMPVVVAAIDRDLRRIPVVACSLLPRRIRERHVAGLALLGLTGLLALIAWEAAMIWASAGADWSRLDIYWVDHLGRWPLMFTAGLVGLAGLYELARRGRPLPLLWFTACYLVGVVGALGLAFPLWHRFLLLSQPPLALGVAAAVVHRRQRLVPVAVTACVAVALAFKLYTLTALPATTTYFRDAWIPDAYSLAKAIPPGPGGVISDPSTSYYIPGATGRRVLTVSSSHVGSPREMQAAADGYRLLHTIWEERDKTWWTTAQELWRQGFRYVVVDHSISLEPPTLGAFSGGPTPVVSSEAERLELSRYFWKLNRIGTIVYDSPTYVVYRLEKAGLR